MNKSANTMSSALVIFISSGFIFPFPAIAEAKKGWSGGIEFEASKKTGTIDDAEINVNANALHVGNKWKNSFNGGLSLYEESGERLSKTIEVSYDAAYSFNEYQYVFNHFSYEHNLDQDLDSRFVEAVGYGHNFLKGKKHELTGEIGFGKRKTDYITEGKSSELENVGYIGIYYDGKINNTTSFSQEVITIGNSSNLVTRSITKLKVDINDKVSLGIKYKVYNSSDAPDGEEDTDTSTNFGLTYSF